MCLVLCVCQSTSIKLHAQIAGSENDPHCQTHLKMAKRLGHGCASRLAVALCDFPCQRYSMAGKRAGAQDPRDLSGALWVGHGHSLSLPNGIHCPML